MDDKVGRLPSCRQQSRAFASLVTGAAILLWVLYIILNWSEPDERHSAVELGGNLIVYNSFFAVVARPIHEEAMHIHSIFGQLLNFFWFLCFLHLERERQAVNGDSIQTSVGLEATGHEALGEEETGDPVADWLAIY